MAQNDMQQFAQDMAKHSRQMAQYITRDLPRKIGVEGKKFFKENFENEGFTDNSNEKWDDVKRRTSGKTKGAASSRKILHGETSELFNSIDYTANVAQVAWGSDKPYAQVHNEGGRAGRGSGFTMPKRQYIGHSNTFDKQMISQMTVDFNRIMQSK